MQETIPRSGRSSGGGNGNTLQYPFLENAMNRGAWQGTVHGVRKSRTQLSNRACTHTHTHTTRLAAQSRLVQWEIAIAKRGGFGGNQENPRDGGSLVGCRLWDCTESDTTEVTFGSSSSSSCWKGSLALNCLLLWQADSLPLGTWEAWQSG